MPAPIATGEQSWRPAARPQLRELRSAANQGRGRSLPAAGRGAPLLGDPEEEPPSALKRSKRRR
jgi:hypothetical protein